MNALLTIIAPSVLLGALFGMLSAFVAGILTYKRVVRDIRRSERELLIKFLIDIKQPEWAEKFRKVNAKLNKEFAPRNDYDGGG